jgi:uncharacterized protein (DUF302 family)
MFYSNYCKCDVATAAERLLAAASRRQMTVAGVHVMKWHEDQADANHGPECRVYDFCNAAWMRQSLEGSQLAATAMPCRVAVFEDKSGTKFAMMKVTAFLSATAANPQVYGPFHKMEQALIDAITEVCDGRAGELDSMDMNSSAGPEKAVLPLPPLELEFA